MFTTPILLLVFNRPQETQNVFNQIKKIKPQQLFIAADGPRKNKIGEDKLCKEVKEIFNDIDWDCKVTTSYNDANLGCKLAVSNSIKWFFKQVEYGIVLEDDCLPDLSFFKYCEELLIKYKDDQRIGIITGRNEDFIFKDSRSYDFSTAGSIWGWGSWRRVIDLYEVNNKSLLNNFKLNIYQATVDNFEKNRLYHQLKWTLDDQLNTWDYQLHAILKLNSMLYIIPQKNLIKNIGFNTQATHTTSLNDKRANSKLESLMFPLKHPEYLFPNRKLSREMVRADSNNYFLFLFLIFNSWLKKRINAF
jgi:hypothetical protein